MADETNPVVCDICERELELGEPFMRAPTVNGEAATACMLCVERMFNETFPTRQ